MQLPIQTTTPSRQPLAAKRHQGGIYHIQAPDNINAAQRFIQACFYQQHKAHIDTFAEHLLALVDQNQQLLAAFGYQSAANRYLFLEQYLDTPIEAVLSAHGCGYVQRNQIVEGGNLASISSGSTRRLIVSLIRYFHTQGFRWLVMTITPKVLNSFQKLGVDLDLIPLTSANPERIHGATEKWGHYYDDEPVVYAGNIASALDKLHAHPLISALIQQSEWPRDDDRMTLTGSI